MSIILEQAKTASRSAEQADLQHTERLCREVLRIEPVQPDALHLLGMVTHCQGRHDEGLATIRRAIAESAKTSADPDVAHTKLCVLNQALKHYRESLQGFTAFADVYFRLGEQQLQGGHCQEAVASFQQALKIRSDWTAAQEKIAEAYWLAGDHRRAIQILEPLVAAHPEMVVAAQILAESYLKTGDQEKAVAQYEAALRFETENADLYYKLGRIHLLNRRLERADQCFQRTLQLDPDHQAAWHDRGAVLLNKGNTAEAQRHFSETLVRDPNHADALCNLGLIHLLANELEESAEYCRRSLQANPKHACTRNILGNVFRARGQLSEAVSEFQQALQLNAANTEAHNNLALSFQTQGRMEDAVAHYRRAMEVRTHCAATHSNYLLSLHYLPQNDLDAHFREHLNWAEAHGCREQRTDFHNSREPERRLRIGYVSPDFRQHPVGSFMLPILAQHDPTEYEVTCYSNVSAPDAVTAQLESLAQRWRVTNWLGDDDLTAKIIEDEIDILVDLAGHTAGNRLTAFAGKPAPIQMTYLGYGSTSGLAAMDYRLTDQIADPEGEAVYYTEQLLRLQSGLLCYQPAAFSPEISASPILKHGAITFGSFNNPAKINAATIAVWAKILSSIPSARLILKYPTFSDSGTVGRCVELFSECGIDRERLEFRGGKLPQAQHLAAYGDVDVMLDTFPYTGSTTTCESLWMGVPVLTLRGNSFVGRISSSILTHLGLPELIAQTTEDYLDRAVALSRAAEQLSQTRNEIRQVMRDSAMCNAEAFTDELEGLYR